MESGRTTAACGDAASGHRRVRCTIAVVSAGGRLSGVAATQLELDATELELVAATQLELDATHNSVAASSSTRAVPAEGKQ